MELYPPDDPFLFRTVIFGIPLEVRWYGLLIMTGALLAAWLVTRRARRRNYDPDHVWNQLMLGLIMGVVGARIYYVAFEWERFAGDPLRMINLTTGGLAIHGAIIGGILSALLYTRYHKIPFWDWADTCIPGFLLAQGIGRWGNFFNQEAYGTPTDLPFGVKIDAAHRLPPYNDLLRYPPNTLFHATFLYESVWNLVGVGLLLLADRRFGRTAPPARRRLRPGDLLFLYAIYYSLGRVWIEGLRTDSLYLGPLRVAQLISLLLMLAGAVALLLNHLRARPWTEPASAELSADAQAAEVAEQPESAPAEMRAEGRSELENPAR
jgi:phosphatidylglycerol---prolipoprotein diacylglyceryl transferase